MGRSRFKQPEDYKKDWLDWWLNDDPPPPSVETKLQQPYVAPPHSLSISSEGLPKKGSITDEPGATNIVVNINMPKIKLPDVKRLDVKKFRNLPLRTILLNSAFAVGMMFAGLATHSFMSKNFSGLGTQHQVLAARGVAGGRAPFTPVAPKYRPELGNYLKDKTAYDSSRAIYSYVDMLQGTEFTVSEQALPDNFISGQKAVDKIAASMAAREPILTASGIAYMHTDIKSGNQKIVLTMKGLLIFIQSPFQHSSGDWQNYLTSLQ